MKKVFIVVFGLLLSSSCLAYNLTDKLLRIEAEWEQVHYNFPEPQKAVAFQRLLGQAGSLTREFPTHAEPVILQAAIILTQASIESPFAALSSVNKARDLLLKAIAINPHAKHGSAFVTLGTLYHKVPGWPVSFGNDKEAEKLLLKALKISPKGIDSNYFYADFLAAKGKSAEAYEYFDRAVNATDNQNKTLGNRTLQAKARLAMQKLI